MARTYGKAQDLIDFTRASGGTALRRVKYGAELVTNGTFDTDLSGWNIDGVDATHTITFENGGARYQSDTTSPVLSLSQPNIMDQTKIYQVIVVISDYVSGALKIDTANGAVSMNGNGTFTYNIKPVSSGYLSLYRATANVDMIIQSVSVKEVTFDTSDGDLVLFNHPNHIPRIEYDADGNLLGLLVEESRTNLVTYSDDFEQSIWSKTNATATKNVIASPDGTVSGNKITANNVNTWHGVHLPFAGISVTAGTAYSFTVFAKAGEYSWLQIGSSTPAFNGTYANINLQNGEVGNSNTTPTVTSVGNGWYKISVTETCILSHSNGSFFIAMYDNDVASRLPSYSGSSSSGLYVWRAMFEAGSFPTSAIPTSGSTATRSADVASLSTSGFGYNQDEGTVVVEGKYTGLGSSLTSGVFELCQAGGSYQGIDVRIKATDYAQSFDSVGAITSDSTSTITPSSTFKIALGFEAGKAGSILTLNGSSTIGVPTVTPSTVDKLEMFRHDRNTDRVLNGHLKSIKYYPRKLLQSQIEELTS